jgi:hypothetical protein
VHVTRTGASMIMDRFFNLAGTKYGTLPADMGWGLGGNSGNAGFGLGAGSAATSDVGLFHEAPEARITPSGSSLTTTVFSEDTYQAVGTITAGTAETISEMGLFNTTTKPFSSTVTGGAAVASTSGTTLTIAANYTPANSTFIQVDSEVLQVLTGSGGTSLTVARAQNGSTAFGSIATADVITAGDGPGGTAISEQLFLHASFTGLALNSGDSIQFTASAQLIPQ